MFIIYIDIDIVGFGWVILKIFRLSPSDLELLSIPSYTNNCIILIWIREIAISCKFILILLASKIINAKSSWILTNFSSKYLCQLLTLTNIMDVAKYSNLIKNATISSIYLTINSWMNFHKLLKHNFMNITR